MYRCLFGLLSVYCPLTILAFSFPELSLEQVQRIGQSIWHNESGKSHEKLVWWNTGELCASLGIGHFIWYPSTHTQGFSQTFPELLTFFKIHGQQVPPWLAQSSMPCPWNNYQEFQQARAHQDPRIKELQQMLAATIGLQACFMVERLKKSLDELMIVVPHVQQRMISKRIQALLTSEQGMYVLVDYLNFKGLGTNPKERYAGKGWGLLQVLQAMDDSCVFPVVAFAQAAERVLTERAHNAPAGSHEQRWLVGWKARLRTYANNTQCSLFQTKGGK